MNLKERVLQGGAYLAARQAVSLVVSLGGVILLTRLIGPANYGLAAGAMAIVALLERLATFGLDAYLIRREEEPTEEVFHQAFSVLLLIGSGVVTVGLLAAPLLVHWFGDARFVPPLQVALPTLLFRLISVPAMAQIERALNYRALAAWQLAEHLAFYAVALPLAALGAGVWAPVAGFWLSKGMIVARSYALTRYRPKLVWSRPLIGEMLGYGFGFSASSWIWQLRGLVNPLVVGRYLGPEAVGYVGLAIRFVMMMTFVKDVAWKLAMVALAKVQGDRARLGRGIEQAMPLQVLAMGPVLAGFATVSPWLLPEVFGREWDEVLVVFPFVALGFLINGVFNMHASALYVLRRNRSVALTNAVHVLLFAGGCLLLVPQVGLVGYGIAEVLALPAYVVIHRQVTKLIPVAYDRTWPWLLALIPPMFSGFVPMPWSPALWLALVVVALWPQRRQQIREYLGYVQWRPA